MNRVHRTRLAAPRNFDLCTGVRPGGKGDSPPGNQAQQSTWVASPPLNLKPFSSAAGRYFTSAAGTSSQTPRTPSRRQRSSAAASAASKSSVSLTITVMPPYASLGDSSKSQAATVVAAATATTTLQLAAIALLRELLRAAGSTTAGWQCWLKRAARQQARVRRCSISPKLLCALQASVLQPGCRAYARARCWLGRLASGSKTLASSAKSAWRTQPRRRRNTPSEHKRTTN